MVIEIEPRYCLGMFLGSAIISVLFQIFIKEDLRRLKAGKRESFSISVEHEKFIKTQLSGVQSNSTTDNSTRDISP